MSELFFMISEFIIRFFFFLNVRFCNKIIVSLTLLLILSYVNNMINKFLNYHFILCLKINKVKVL